VRYVLPAAVAIGVGLTTLIGLLTPIPLLIGVRLVMVDWAAVLAGLALLLGVLNLLLVHMRKVQVGSKGWSYSLVVVATVVVVLFLGLLEGQAAIFESGSLTHTLFSGVVMAGQATLASLVMFVLVYAAARALRNRPSPWTVGFLVVVVIVLIGWLPLTVFQVSGLSNLRNWLIQVPGTAGARGILLGVALGSVLVGLRVLTGVERPYKD
jgi:hypothetical protein